MKNNPLDRAVALASALLTHLRAAQAATTPAEEALATTRADVDLNELSATLSEVDDTISERWKSGVKL